MTNIEISPILIAVIVSGIVICILTITHRLDIMKGEIDRLETKLQIVENEVDKLNTHTVTISKDEWEISEYHKLKDAMK